MVKLSNDVKTEVVYDGESERFTVYVDELGKVSGVQMTSKLAGQDDKTAYMFELTETPDGPACTIVSAGTRHRRKDG